jgi:hypothetical protein
MYLCFSSNAYTQIISNQVIGSAGGYDVADNQIGSLAWTIGEPIVETVFANDYVLTQGFHQPSGIIKLHKEIIYRGDDITVYPNPSINDITVDIVNINFTKVKYTLSDVLGQIIFAENNISVSANAIRISLNISYIKPGIYFINVYSDDNRYVKTIKFLKIYNKF